MPPELPEELVDLRHRPQSYTMDKQIRNVPSQSSSLAGEYALGDQVEHKLFGRGKIMAIEGRGDTAKLTIEFSGNIRKKLISKYAKLVQLQT